MTLEETAGCFLPTGTTVVDNPRRPAPGRDRHGHHEGRDPGPGVVLTGQHHRLRVDPPSPRGHTGLDAGPGDVGRRPHHLTAWTHACPGGFPRCPVATSSSSPRTVEPPSSVMATSPWPGSRCTAVVCTPKRRSTPWWVRMSATSAATSGSWRGSSWSRPWTGHLGAEEREQGGELAAERTRRRGSAGAPGAGSAAGFVSEVHTAASLDAGQVGNRGSGAGVDHDVVAADPSSAAVPVRISTVRVRRSVRCPGSHEEPHVLDVSHRGLRYGWRGRTVRTRTTWSRNSAM